MKQLTRVEKLIKINRNRVTCKHKRGIKVRPQPLSKTRMQPGHILTSNNRGRSIKYNENTIDVSHLNQGMYIAELVSRDWKS